MIPNAAIRNLIREEKVHQIYSQMQVGQTKFGHADDEPVAACDLFQQEIDHADEALGRATEPDELRNLMIGQAQAPPGVGARGRPR